MYPLIVERSSIFIQVTIIICLLPSICYYVNSLSLQESRTLHSFVQSYIILNSLLLVYILLIITHPFYMHTRYIHENEFCGSVKNFITDTYTYSIETNFSTYWVEIMIKGQGCVTGPTLKSR